MLKTIEKPVVVREFGPVEPIAAQLRAGHRAFKRDRTGHRFEGVPSRLTVLTESRERQTALAALAATDYPFEEHLPNTIRFFRFTAGEYLLPTAWRAQPEESALHILMLGHGPDDALIVSLESGVQSIPVKNGKLISVSRPCRFWLGPVFAEEIFIAVSGIAMDGTERDMG